MDATLDDMGYRGEDASRTHADWGRHAPWQSSPGAGAENTEPPADVSPWGGEAGRNGPDGAYSATDGGYGYPQDQSYPSDAGYAGYDRQDYDRQDYGQQDYGQQDYGHYDDHGPDARRYGGPDGYDDSDGYGGPGAGTQYTGYGYQQAEEHPARYAQPDHGRQQGTGYGVTGGGYQGSSGYPALPRGTGGYPAEDAGNDWYGGQPAAASGASFADTGTYTLNGRVIDEYGTGPSQALRDPVRGYPPAPGQPPGGAQLPAPALPAASGPQALPHTGQQERYDGDYGTYPGYSQDEPGVYGDYAGQDGYPGHDGYPEQGGYDEPRGYPGEDGYPQQGGYDEPGGYDDYQDYDGPAAGFAPGQHQDGPGPDDYHGYMPDEDPYQDDHPAEKKRKARRRDKAGRRAAADTAAAAGSADSAGGDSGRRLGPVRLRGKTPLVAALAVGVVAIAGAGTYFFLSSQSAANNPNSAGPIPTSGTMPSTQTCTQQLGAYCHIELRTDDPTPLSVTELFPPAFANEKDKSSFTLAATKLDKKCSDAVIGQDLISQLSKGQCTQALRASYLSGDQKIMGTIGVLNLATTNQAHYAGRVVGQNDFIAPLSSSKGIANKLGQGTGVVESEFKGHYLILTWAEFVDGTTPSTDAQDKQLEQFSNDLIAGTANISLSQRMVTGAPATAAAG